MCGRVVDNKELDDVRKPKGQEEEEDDRGGSNKVMTGKV